MKRKKKNHKKLLRDEADYLWRRAVIEKYGNKCVICGEPAQDIHHFVSRGKSLALRVCVENGVPLCRKHHFLFHYRPDKFTGILIAFQRGKEWIDFLEEKRKEKPQMTVQWLESVIEKLKKKT